mmetsp:Transcript_13012/g.38321  ORF Transcript_13012/g.38321 Transcript_13012/m.38321 type:complete len:329 (-) Transcript_13012:219-1205(-)|eukprot:6563577-Prymnesium_polylepis.1
MKVGEQPRVHVLVSNVPRVVVLLGRVRGRVLRDEVVDRLVAILFQIEPVDLPRGVKLEQRRVERLRDLRDEGERHRVEHDVKALAVAACDAARDGDDGTRERELQQRDEHDPAVVSKLLPLDGQQPADEIAERQQRGDVAKIVEEHLYRHPHAADELQADLLRVLAEDVLVVVGHLLEAAEAALAVNERELEALAVRRRARREPAAAVCGRWHLRRLPKEGLGDQIVGGTALAVRRPLECPHQHARRVAHHKRGLRVDDRRVDEQQRRQHKELRKRDEAEVEPHEEHVAVVARVERVHARRRVVRQRERGRVDVLAQDHLLGARRDTL